MKEAKAEKSRPEWYLKVERGQKKRLQMMTSSFPFLTSHSISSIVGSEFAEQRMLHPSVIEVGPVRMNTHIYIRQIEGCMHSCQLWLPNTNVRICKDSLSLKCGVQKLANWMVKFF